MLGLILSSSCGTYTVISNNKDYLCKPRGLFRHQNLKPAVGDCVEFDETDLTIVKILPRKNYLIRPSIANVDELAIVMSTLEPLYSSFLIDKFLAYANYFDIKANVIITKLDLISIDDLTQKKNMLEQLGIKVFYFSKKTLLGLEEIQTLFHNKTVALMGQTGVGKSSLLNALIPESKREIGEYSIALGRGKHQTKEVILIPFGSGFIADTPGFSSLELPFYKEDLAQCFPGFKNLSMECKFNNCLHLQEYECKIKEALNAGKIAQESYDNYVQIQLELKHRKDRY